jgi:hypothetical protein
MLVEQTRAHLRRETKVIAVGGKQPDGTPKAAAWTISPTWTNAGSTSAKEVRFSFVAKVYDTPLNHNFEELRPLCPEPPRPKDSNPATVISPGAPLTQFAILLPIADILAAQQQLKTIILSGHIEYRDVYPETSLHREDWCIAFVPNDVEQIIFSPIDLRTEVD